MKHELTARDGMITALQRVSIFATVLEGRVVRLGVSLIRTEEDQSPELDCTAAELLSALAGDVELSDQPVVGDAWQNHLLEVILSDDNVFARKAELVGLDEMGPSLVEQVSQDLKTLRRLYDIQFGGTLTSSISLDGLRPLRASCVDRPRLLMKQNLHEESDWGGMVGELADFYARHGAGEFGRFRAFRWVKDIDGGHLQPAASPDPIQLSDLVEYDWQREEVRRNTEKLLAGLPSNNILLYGDRGTGKSSTVKAMLNEFPETRLRLVEITKESLIDLPQILSILSKRPEKFILFVDDLSFEENETQYKALKTVLEGGIEARPANVVLYATSNRRNIVKERFSDRVAQDDEVHPNDTMQEKLALSDRFGIKTPFLSPDQTEYLRIVTSLAERAGIEVTDEIRRKALNWQHARSGRAARQFVDYIIGEIGLDQEHRVP